jgi:hypothetical protein
MPSRRSGFALSEAATEDLALSLGEWVQARGFRVRNLFPVGEPRAELIRLARTARADLVIVADADGPRPDLPQTATLAGAAFRFAPCSVLALRPMRLGRPPTLESDSAAETGAYVAPMVLGEPV